MIPRVCANCEHGALVVDGGELVAAWCTEPPSWVHVIEPRGHYCGRFEMAEQPRFTVQDDNGKEAEDVQVDES